MTNDVAAAAAAPPTGEGDLPPTKKPKVTHHAAAEEEEEDIASSSSSSSSSSSQPAAVDAVTLTLVSPASAWAFPPEFTHQFFPEEDVPVGYPDLAVEWGFNACTATWTLDITYDEAAGRQEKEEKPAAAPQASDETAGAPPSPPPLLPLASSNDGDDLALLRCLLPALPPVEGCACRINGKIGWLLPKKGFVSEAEGQAVAASLPMTTLPFGTERASYHYTPRERKEEEEEDEADQAMDFRIFAALPSTNGLSEEEEKKRGKEATYYQGTHQNPPTHPPLNPTHPPHPTPPTHRHRQLPPPGAKVGAVVH